MAGQITSIPLPVILSAINGDKNALIEVVVHFQRYIRALATKPRKDEHGNTYMFVDEDMRLRLEVKLVYAIITSFKMLPT